MRRVLDNVSVTALYNCDDKSLVKSIYDTIGEGTLVKDVKVEIVRFDKSNFGLEPMTLSKFIRKCANDFHKQVNDVNEYYIVDSFGDTHTVNSKVVGILKGIALYRTVCPIAVSDCLSDILKEIDLFLRTGKYQENHRVILNQPEDNEPKNKDMITNKHLMDYCRQEVLGLFREAGVDIG